MSAALLEHLSEPAGLAIRWMVDQIVASVHPRQVILFGSYARGEAQAESDVDLLLVVDDTDDKAHTRRVAYQALIGRWLPVDVVVATAQEMRLRRYIPGTVIYPAVREGYVVYERP